MKLWHKRAGLVIGTAVIMYGMVYADVVWRAKEAYQEGEKYWRWAEHPEEREQFLNAKRTADKAKLDERLSKGALSKDDYDHAMELLQFEYEQAMKESSIKYAYVWY